MKILVILHKVKKKGGAVLQILKMVKSFKEEGHYVSIFSFDSLQTTKNFIFNSLNGIKSLQKTIENFDPDIILTSEPIITTTYTLFARRKKIPIVIRIGSVYDSFYAGRILEKISPDGIYSSLYYSLKNLLKEISKIIFKKIDLVIFNSHFLQDNYFKITPNSIVIHNGVEIFSKETFELSDPIKLVYVGRIEPRKSIELIIKSLGILKLKNHDFSFSIIGNIKLYPKYWKKLVELISYYGITDKVKIIGEVDNNFLLSTLEKHDILLFSTDDRNFPITEGLPNVVLEGMSCGLAIIATPVAGLPEIIKEENGYLVYANSKDFAEKISFLINNPAIILSMKKQNVIDIKMKFTLQKAAEKYLSAFHEISTK